MAQPPHSQASSAIAPKLGDFVHKGRPNGPFRVRSRYRLRGSELLEETVTFTMLGAAMRWLGRAFARGAFAAELVDETREPKGP